MNAQKKQSEIQSINELNLTGKLPEVLSIIELFLLEPNNPKEKKLNKAIIIQAINSRSLKIFGVDHYTHVEETAYGMVMVMNQNSMKNVAMIHYKDFSNWMIKQNLRPLKGQLANWGKDELDSKDKEREGEIFSVNDKKIHNNDSMPFYSALRELKKRLPDLTCIEFGLLVLNGHIHIFERSQDKDGYLKQLFGSAKLINEGISVVLNNEYRTLQSTLTNFRYDKTNIEQFTPPFRYIQFHDACRKISYFTNILENEVEEYLTDKFQREKAYPQHPYFALFNQKYKKLVINSAYPDYMISEILSNDFGLCKYEMAFDVEIYLKEIKEYGGSDNDIKLINNLLNTQLGASSSLVEKQNTMAKIAALRPEQYAKFARSAFDIVRNIVNLESVQFHKDRIKRFVWLNVLNKRKVEIVNKNSNDEEIKELDGLLYGINIINEQLGCFDNELQSHPIKEKKSIFDNKNLERKPRINKIFKHYKN